MWRRWCARFRSTEPRGPRAKRFARRSRSGSLSPQEAPALAGCDRGLRVAMEGSCIPAVILVGAQWGDEGKGKATDLLGDRADYVVRYQGGNPAGHTLAIASQKAPL